MTREDCVTLGYIQKAHGLKGEVKFILDVQNPQDYIGIRTLYLGRDGEALEKVRISRLNLSGKGQESILKLVGVNDREGAEALAGSQVYFPLERLPQLADGEVYYFEIIGFTVTDRQRGPIGTLRDIYETGAEDLLVVDSPEGKEILIPFHRPIYQGADKESHTVLVDLPEGLLELYLGEE